MVTPVNNATVNAMSIGNSQSKEINSNNVGPTFSRSFKALFCITGLLSANAASKTLISSPQMRAYTPYSPSNSYPFSHENNRCLNWINGEMPPEFAAMQIKPTIYPNGVTIQGLMPNGKLNGDALKTYPNGGTDVGYFDDGAFRHGIRTYPLEDGRVMEGSFLNDELEGKCSIQFSDGHTKTGICHNGKLVNGTTTNIDGLHITGKFDQDEQLIEGTVSTQDGRTLQGTFLDKSLHGDNCTIKYANGDIATGTYIKGKMVYGTATLANGAVFEGSFNQNGKLDGENCTIKYVDGGVATGTYINGNMVHGTATAKNGAMNQGTFQGDDLHGDNCLRRYVDGSMEEGKFDQGILVKGDRYVDGNIESGTFDRQTGELLEGKIVFQNGGTKTVPSASFDWTLGLTKILFG